MGADAYNRRTLIFVAALGLTVFALMAFASVTNTEKRLADLARIRAALAAYHADHHAYPIGPGISVGDSRNVPADRWIPDLVPDYLDKVPRDPRLLVESNRQYLYISDGKNYKLIAHGPEDFGYASHLKPKMVDPVRATYAYGYWTKGAREW